MTQKELTGAADVEQSGMAQLLTRMEHDGFIQRQPDSQDRRTNLVQLTDAGKVAVPEVIESLEYFNERPYAGFTGEERVPFARILLRLIANLEELPECDLERGRTVLKTL